MTYEKQCAALRGAILANFAGRAQHTARRNGFHVVDADGIPQAPALLPAVGRLAARWGAHVSPARGNMGVFPRRAN